MSADHGTQEDAQDDHGFETDIRRVEVGDDEANPHPQGKGDTEEGEQSEGLAGGAALGEQQALEGQSPGGHRRDSGGHAQLDQQ